MICLTLTVVASKLLIHFSYNVTSYSVEGLLPVEVNHFTENALAARIGYHQANF